MKDPERCFLSGVLVAEAHGLVAGVSARIDRKSDTRDREKIGVDLDRSRTLMREAVKTHGAACRLELKHFEAETKAVHKAVVAMDLPTAKEEALSAMITTLDCLGNLHEKCAPKWLKVVQRGEYGWSKKRKKK
jgi:hypothetical protein